MGRPSKLATLIRMPAVCPVCFSSFHLFFLDPPTLSFFMVWSGFSAATAKLCRISFCSVAQREKKIKIPVVIMKYHTTSAPFVMTPSIKKYLQRQGEGKKKRVKRRTPLPPLLLLPPIPINGYSRPRYHRCGGPAFSPLLSSSTMRSNSFWACSLANWLSCPSLLKLKLSPSVSCSSLALFC